MISYSEINCIVSPNFSQESAYLSISLGTNNAFSLEKYEIKLLSFPYPISHIPQNQVLNKEGYLDLTFNSTADLNGIDKVVIENQECDIIGSI